MHAVQGPDEKFITNQVTGVEPALNRHTVRVTVEGDDKFYDLCSLNGSNEAWYLARRLVSIGAVTYAEVVTVEGSIKRGKPIATDTEGGLQ